MKVWKTRGPDVGCGAWTPTDRFVGDSSPQRVHMSEGSSTLGERLRCEPFHSTYYFRIERKTKSNRGWPR